MPPPTVEKAFTQTLQVIALFKDIKAGTHLKKYPWIVFDKINSWLDLAKDRQIHHHQRRPPRFFLSYACP
ncbi:hypothetical protein K469DRAFT_201998 [Zopfia rhizophila CBS 207.26]|uniref:Uncharacterized protein n=1 Tax=Zopfia rhizophila CBS 207.26 TaxID=1314779 RepID=A0A6A6DVZ5_9PEZI|nr:hypothetical protein K469DRAFT_201998 [Zopfia rhizophila CBS 207.26]